MDCDCEWDCDRKSWWARARCTFWDMTWRSGVWRFEPFPRIFWCLGILNLSTLGAIGVQPRPSGLVANTEDWLQILDIWETDPLRNWFVFKTHVTSCVVGVDVLRISRVVTWAQVVLVMKAVVALRTNEADPVVPVAAIRLNVDVDVDWGLRGIFLGGSVVGVVVVTTISGWALTLTKTQVWSSLRRSASHSTI